jgi:hypothetical protein
MPLLAALNNRPGFALSSGGRHAIPIFSFGDPRRAHVATIGLNPSDKEFLHRGLPILPGKQRFATPWLPTLPHTVHTVTRVQADGNSYFTRQPYRRWFGIMERLLQSSPSRYSYWQNSACHLDLTPWATSPVWRHLGHVQKRHLLHFGLPALRYQLGFAGGTANGNRASPIGKILLNGQTVVDEVLRAFSMPIPSRFHVATLYAASSASCSLKIYTTSILGIATVGWNLPLAGPFGALAVPHIAPFV